MIEIIHLCDGTSQSEALIDLAHELMDQGEPDLLALEVDEDDEGGVCLMAYVTKRQP